MIISRLRRTLRKAQQDEITDLAATIAFYAFFGLFPLLLAVVATAGHLLESAEVQARVFDFLAESFPGSAELLRSSITSVVAARGTIGVAAVLGLLWSASAGFGAASRGVNRAMGTPLTRSVLKTRLRYLVIALAVSALLVAYVLLTSAGHLLEIDATWLSWLGVGSDAVTKLKARVTSFVLVFLPSSFSTRGRPRSTLGGATSGAEPCSRRSSRRSGNSRSSPTSPTSRISRPCSARFPRSWSCSCGCTSPRSP